MRFRDKKPLEQNSLYPDSLLGFFNPDFDEEYICEEDMKKHKRIKKKMNFADIKGLYAQMDPDPEDKGRLNCNFTQGRVYEGAKLLRLWKELGFPECAVQEIWFEKDLRFHKLHHAFSYYFMKKELRRRELHERETDIEAVQRFAIEDIYNSVFRCRRV